MLRKSLIALTVAGALIAPAAAQARVPRMSLVHAHRATVQAVSDPSLALSEFQGYTTPVGSAAVNVGSCQRLGRNAVMCNITFVGSFGPKGQPTGVTFRQAKAFVVRFRNGNENVYLS